MQKSRELLEDNARLSAMVEQLTIERNLLRAAKHLNRLPAGSK